MKDEELKEKTAKIMGWSKRLNVGIDGNIDFVHWVDKADDVMFDCRLTGTQYLDDEWNPLRNIEHFFMVVNKLDLYFQRNPKEPINDKYTVFVKKANIDYCITDKSLNGLMPLVIKAICEVKIEFDSIYRPNKLVNFTKEEE